MKPARRSLVLVCALTVIGVLVAGAFAVDWYVGQRPATGVPAAAEQSGQVDFSKDFLPADELVQQPADAAFSTVWQAPAAMPGAGSVTEASIPGTTSGFPARDAFVYLPPAYLTTPRAELPVVILMAGQPGSPRDWLDGGRLAAVLDAYAADNDGLAPVVVVVDDLGTGSANPACVDSPRGKAQTYLTVDVPAWITSNLQVQPDSRNWAVAGLSNGGTCALILSVTHPDSFRTFVTISGEDDLTIGEHQQTVKELFAGSQTAWAAQDPVSIMGTQQFPDTAGFVVGGSDDPYLGQAQHVVTVAKAAGMSITFLELPGGHGWSVWGPGFQSALPWLGTRMGLVT